MNTIHNIIPFLFFNSTGQIRSIYPFYYFSLMNLSLTV
nr:MAG TPA: hypothetical protein [Caudoviricetes sp.]